MNTRERLKRIRQSKSWFERLELARDHLPGTPHDKFIRNSLEVLARWQGNIPAVRADNEAWLLKVGEAVARAIWHGDSPFFRTLADSLDTHVSYKPQPDQRRAALAVISRTPVRVFSVRKILRFFIAKKIVPAEILLPTNETQRHSEERTIRKLCAEFGMKTDGKAGKPKADASAHKPRN